MLEDFNVVLNHLLKFYRLYHPVFESLDRIKKVIKEHAQQTNNSAMVPCNRCKPYIKCTQGFAGRCRSIPCMLAQHQ